MENEQGARDLLKAVRDIMTAGDARERIATNLLQQTLSDIELLPTEEREDLKKEAWLVFERANQNAQERQIQALKAVITGTQSHYQR